MPWIPDYLTKIFIGYNLSCYIVPLCISYIIKYVHYVAFASKVTDGTILFMDKPQDFVFPFLEYKALSVEELSARCDVDANLSALGKAELAQIEYWKPQAIKEVIFNFWD